MNVINKLFYNMQLNKKSWRIRGVETDPTQNNEDDNITLKDKDIDLTISQEKGTSEVILTFKIDDKEYNILLYDEVIDFINKLKRR